MAQIKVKKLNEATVFIDGDEHILKELENYFTTKSPKARFSSKYQSGYWDGTVKKYSRFKSTLPIGLVYELKRFAKRGGYTVECDFETKFPVDFNDFIRFVRVLDIRLPNNSKPHKYQLAAVWDALTQKHLCIEVPTSGGKTLIIYLICRFLLACGAAKKILIVANTTTLVDQCFDDWYEFGWGNVRDYLHRIYSGYDKHFNSPITISTWQSIYKDRQVFQEFDVLIVDEAHGAKAKSLLEVSEASVNAQWRIGTSGTYPEFDEKDSRCDYFNIVGSLGRIKKYTTYQEMEERGQVAKLSIRSIIMKYPIKFRRHIRDNFRGNYAQELDEIHNVPERMEFICDLVNNLEENVMVLFTKKDKHGKPLKQFLEENCPGKRVIYIDGDVKTEERNLTRALAEKKKNLIILASYGTFSTGISIKNIHYLILASGYKSKIKVLQSIGRALRRLKGVKEKAIVFDLVDDCKIGPERDSMGNQIPGYVNFSIKHYKEREAIYEKQGFDWKSIVRKLTIKGF